MKENNRIIDNIDATMSMKNMLLSEKDKEQLKECLEGSVSFQDTIDELIKEYTQE